MKYCSKCGEIAMGTMLMCANCGAKTFQDAPPSNTSENEQKNKNYTKQAIKNTTSSAAGIEPADLLNRFFAFIIDGIIVAASGALIPILILATMSNLTSEMQDITYSALSFFVGLLYYSILHSSEKQATFGKQVCKIKIVSESGMVSFWLAAARAILPTIFILGGGATLGLLSVPIFVMSESSSAMQGGAITLMVLLVIGLLIGPYISIFMRDDRKSLYDLICKTQVVKI